MANRGRWGLLVASLLVGACTNTFIDLTPDSGDGGREVVILPPPLCGDHVVDPGEECDDGNRKNGDDCTWDCLLGAGDPVPDPDPATSAYVATVPPEVLPAVDQPPFAGGGASEDPLMSIAGDADFTAVTWQRNPPALGSPAQISTRFLGPDGSLIRDEVIVGPMSGWRVFLVATAALGDEVLLLMHTESDGIWGAAVSRLGGFAVEPTVLDPSPNARSPAVASAESGFMMASYDGSDTRRCEHNGSGPSRILLRLLTPDGTTDGMPDPVALEEEYGAWTAPDLAAGDDDMTGMLWWRASTEGAPTCTLRFGVADAGLTTIADGGVIAAGLSGRIAAAEGSYSVAWRTTDSAGEQQLGFASFDDGALLLAPPVLHDMPFDSFMGDVELATGDHGLLAVVLGYDLTSGARLFFLRTDLLGRAVGTPMEVDPSCTRPTCSFGPYNVAWAGDAFLVIYFVTLNLGEPTETTVMRLVRLVPAT
jgi:cysteine-rich repeat protein